MPGRRHRLREPASGWMAGVALLVVMLEPAAGQSASPDGAQQEHAAAEGEVLVPVQSQHDADAPKIGLDDLLRLPNSFEADVDRRGGATASEWRARFAGARKAFADAKEKLVELDRELDKTSSSSSAWQVAAPGSSDPQTSPLSLRLRQDLKDQRVRIEEAERRLRALHVEADLAAVPAEWRE